jgi:hypothetical protein
MTPSSEDIFTMVIQIMHIAYQELFLSI